MQKTIHNLLLAFLIIIAASCAPQSIKKDHNGFEILPDPKFEYAPTSSSNLLTGKSFIGPIQESSSGKISSVIQFHDDGKISQVSISYPERVNRNNGHEIGFYNIFGRHVELVTYAYDSGFPGYRYFKGAYLIGEQGNELIRNGTTIYQRISTKYPISRKWKIGK